MQVLVFGVFLAILAVFLEVLVDLVGTFLVLAPYFYDHQIFLLARPVEDWDFLVFFLMIGYYDDFSLPMDH